MATIRNKSIDQSKLPARVFSALLILSLAGQLAWAVENQFYNTFLYNRITPNPQAVSWMVSITAIVSTLTTIFMGTLSDRTRSKWGKRKPYLFIGYILWGIFTAIFPASAYFQPVALGIFMAILFDSIMTFFGATANDAAFSAYVADVTTVENRGRVSGAIQITTWIAFIIVYGGAGFIIESIDYTGFFYIVGGFTLLIGLIFAPQLKDPAVTDKPVGTYWSQIAETFQWKNLLAQRDLFLLLISLTLFMLAINTFFSYLMIYLQHYVKLSIGDSSLLVGAAIGIGGIGLAVPLGILVDKWGRRQVAILAVLLESAGLILFSFSKSLPTLILSGIVWLGAFTGWVIATGAWTKDLYPEEKRGQFAGYFVLFNVAFTMIPGSLLGGWLSTAYGIPTILDGQAGTIPTPLIFQVAAGLILLTLIPLLIIRRNQRADQKAGRNH
ncbi:MAG: MFS transporter [Anaerolineaceae bacterium]|nr:MFS transporter [Anaerolineaceae bacterium]MBN2676874.1 MFS transporter [Anaerolineaceae bacterium]